MNDTDLRADVEDALEFEPATDANQIGVAVQNGVVTLSGHVTTYAARLAAERAVARVKGVRGIAQEVEVRPAGSHLTADDEIARRVLEALAWNSLVPMDSVKVRVAEGHVTLSGRVEWNYQRTAAELAIAGMSGVKGILNSIEITKKASPADVRQRIENALKRDAELDAAGIRVMVHDGTVTLEGKVDCWGDRMAAENAAWAAPGVQRVNDQLRIS
ncbi:BON domain-containing protein [Paracoccus nototheniae]|uniref:BON domain-containing protein n=1 Tax=Paracoccus nototheniae TaxID=2489002 RepID=A0ABW4DWR7_9RHOB|nr:BON domain-containing protein [Paracoccus nototheniae]